MTGQYPWPQVGELVSARTGLHFPPERYADLRRALKGAASELGLADADECARWLLAAHPTRTQMQAVINRLTVGETYFFRDSGTFQALADEVLPALVRNHVHDRHIRIWSAGCCTGEEAYSIAILLREYLPGWPEWRITLLGTDINERFLQKASAAEYGQWSFREDTCRVQERYFRQRANGRFVLLSEIRRMVQFVPFNLATDDFPPAGCDAQQMDLILCRNVLMYFTPEQACRVIEKFHGALKEDGWLVVSPSEGSHTMFRAFTALSFSGGALYRKADRSSAAIEMRPTGLAPDMPAANTDLPARARDLADQGRLREALACCNQWIEAAGSDPAAWYLRATVLQELRQLLQARQSLQQAVFLDPGFVLAHVALGNLARAEGDTGCANRHFGRALHLLEMRDPGDTLPESGGRTAGQLRQIFTAMQTVEVCT